jgi:hypothetical protein
MSLNLKMSAGEMKVDFSSLNLTSFDVKIAAGTITLTLPISGSYSGVVDGAASTMKIIIPNTGKLCIQSDTAVSILTLPVGFDRSTDCGKTGVPTLDIKNAVGVVNVEFAK